MPKRRPADNRKRQILSDRVALASRALASLADAPLMLEENALVARIEFARAVIRGRGRIDARYTIPAARTLTERMVVSGGVAVIPVTGAIWSEPNFWTKYYGDTACTEVADAAEHAAADPKVGLIVLLGNSPGGSVFGLEETSQRLMAIRKRKPIESVVEGMCASACYYLLSSASKIHAGPSSSVGSIGCIMSHWDWSKALEDYGLKITSIHHGKHKDDGSPFRPLDGQGRATLQNWVNSYGDQFVAAVARHRAIEPKTVNEKFGQGKVFIASEALHLGLIDSIQTLNDRLTSHRDPTHKASATTPLPPVGQASTLVEPLQTQAKVSTVNKRIKAALYALELVDSPEASDEVCKAALGAFARARGTTVPADDSAIVSMLTTPPAQASAPAEGSDPGSTPAGGTKAPSPRQFTAAQFRAMSDEVHAAADLINAGRATPLISSEQISDAVTAYTDGTKGLSAIQAGWRDTVAKDPGMQPPNVQIKSEPIDRLAPDAEAHLLKRMGFAKGDDAKRDTRALAGASLLDIAMAMATAMGSRLEGSTPMERALHALSMRPGVAPVGSIHASSYNRPSDFPNLLSNIAGKVLDSAIELAEVTYPRWTQRMQDLPDFNPATVLGAGSFTTMDAKKDGAPAEQLAMGEELKGWLEVATFANKVGFTPIMMVSNSLDAFTQYLLSLGYAHENTLNGLCVDLLVGNVTLADAIALFHASHGNLISASAGAPSATQAKKMRVAHRSQTGVSTTKRINSTPKVVLVPVDLEDDAKQTYYSIERLNEAKVAATDATINVHRGTIADVVVEADLSSAVQWYTIDTMFRTIVHGFLAGYGRGGRRTSWFDPDSETRWVKLEGNMGAAAVGYRGIVRNNGT